jgi:GTP diphosphokinase / guanosine-3',5'-bis(diphosphate) 3'-diphosphatase
VQKDETYLIKLESPNKRIESLCRIARSYLTADQVRELRLAYKFSSLAHDGQRRQSGEPYIQHPLSVAHILAQMHMDHETLIAAMLHDVIEDTPIAKSIIRNEFGSEVADIVDGLSKLTHIEFESQAEAQAKNFQKMLLAMANDIRVILVKLADRLHNMRTISALNSEKQRRIARETLQIYAPIAQRLGMNAMRLELEELGFESLYPLRHDVIARVIQKVRGNRKEVVAKIRSRITRRLRQENLVAHVVGREKHLYSIYRKMREKRLHFSEVRDVYAFRIIVNSVDTCYRALGVIHGLYKPVPDTFKDYIALPKSNGYQSLHTVLFGPFGAPLEVQIRTNEMDQVAEVGIAAHWTYKIGETASKAAHKRARDWLHSVIEMQSHTTDSQEFLENVRIDLFPDEVYVFTPKGAIMNLPKGATAVDFAYAIHTGLGNSAVGSRINRRLVPLGTQLNTGDGVEILISSGSQPNPAWLNFVVTAKARTSIHHALKSLQSDEAKILGKRLLNRELAQFGLSIEEIDSTNLNEVLASFKLADLNSLLVDIGLGSRPAPIVARALRTEDNISHGKSRENNSNLVPLIIHGTEGMVVTIPKCCSPIPGDPIIGLITTGRGIVIHHPSCKNVIEFRSAPDKWVEVQWANNLNREFSSDIILDVINQRGVLATVAAKCAAKGANIEGVEMSELDDQISKMRLTIGVNDRKHLADVIRVLRNSKSVVRVSRKRK